MSVKRLLVVSHVAHVQDQGKLYAYGPYVRELDVWCDLFPEVVIAAPCEDGAAEGDRIAFSRSNLKITPIPASGGHTWGAKLKQFILLPWIVAKLCIAMASADAIHVRCPGNLGLLGVVLGPLFSKRLVAKYAGQWTGYPGEARTVRWQRRLLASRWWKGVVTVYGEWPDQPSHVVPFFTSVMTRDHLDRARAISAQDKSKYPFTIAFVGRLSSAKNVDVLIEAVARLSQDGIDARCHIVGQGEQAGALESLVQQRSLQERVRFAGGVEFERVFDFYEDSHVLVLASETEGWPKSIAEAMACGLICVGSNRGLVPWMLSAGRGFTVEPRDVEALTEILRTLAIDRELRHETSRAAAAFGQRYSLESLREALATLLSERWQTKVTVSAGAEGRRTAAGDRASLPNAAGGTDGTMTALGVMNLVDTLSVGGTERVAVNIANQLAERGHRSFLCTTRKEGKLAELVSPHVGRLALHRKRTLELDAIRRLTRFMKDHQIDVIHAHGSSILTANLASRWAPYPKILWHDHYGTNERRERPVWLYRRLVGRASGVVAVSRPLADWSLNRLGFRPDRVWCLPNFVESVAALNGDALALPGAAGQRIVSVANLRPVKDHPMLLEAMVKVVSQCPQAHLLLVGGLSDQAYVERVRQQIESSALSKHVTLLGERDDVPRILAGCDIGVLSSRSEGLPISLLEYGAAGLATVVTDVGQCRAVVGDAGRVVPSGSPGQMADELIRLIQHADQREQRGREFQTAIERHFGAAAVMDRWLEVYDKVMAS